VSTPPLLPLLRCLSPAHSQASIHPFPCTDPSPLRSLHLPFYRPPPSAHPYLLPGRAVTSIGRLSPPPPLTLPDPPVSPVESAYLNQPPTCPARLCRPESRRPTPLVRRHPTCSAGLSRPDSRPRQTCPSSPLLRQERLQVLHRARSVITAVPLQVDVPHRHTSLAFEQAQLTLMLGLPTSRTALPVLLQGREVTPGRLRRAASRRPSSPPQEQLGQPTPASRAAAPPAVPASLHLPRRAWQSPPSFARPQGRAWPG